MSIKSCFNNYSEATIAAIEFVIGEYGDEPWFNGMLRKLMTDMHLKLCSETFRRPLIFYHHYKGDEVVITGYSGYHYLITEMERFHALKNWCRHSMKWLLTL